ncbi:MAG: hypothetical protein ACO1N3_01650 [Gammaproteobacteria bacterium]
MIFNYKKMIVTALLLNATHVWADVFNKTPTQDYDGFYVGGLIGLQNLTNSVHYMVSSGSDQIGTMGFIGGLYVGFDYNFSLDDTSITYTDSKMGPVAAVNDFKIGIEGFGNGLGGVNSSATSTSLPVVTCTSEGLVVSANYVAPSTATYKVSTPYNAGIRLLPAYQFQPGIFGHLIIGWIYSNFSVNDNGRNGFINDSFGMNGIQGGLGWQTAISTPFSWRLDMIYSYYGSHDSIGRGLSSASASQGFTNKLSTLEADISLVYKF